MVIIHGAVILHRTAVVHAGRAHLGMEVAHGATKITAAAKVTHAAAEIAPAKASTEAAAEVAAATETAAAARHGVGCKTKGAE
jgi:hypothetical protein